MSVCLSVRLHLRSAGSAEWTYSKKVVQYSPTSLIDERWRVMLEGWKNISEPSQRSASPFSTKICCDALHGSPSFSGLTEEEWWTIVIMISLKCYSLFISSSDWSPHNHLQNLQTLKKELIVLLLDCLQIDYHLQHKREKGGLMNERWKIYFVLVWWLTHHTTYLCLSVRVWV